MIYAIVNQKGGTGKTITAAALAGIAAEEGARVLQVDLDSQASLTAINRAGILTGSGGTMRALQDPSVTAEEIRKGSIADILPASNALSAAEKVLTDTGKEYRLKEALEAVCGCYDVVLIDCPPALSTLSVNALTAADRVIIPALADTLSYQGIINLYQTIQAVRRYTNKGLLIDGILITQYDRRKRIARDCLEALEDLAARIGTRVYTAKIRSAVAVAEAAARRTSLTAYAPTCTAAADYVKLWKEITSRE